MKLKKKLVSVVLAAAMLLASFAVPQTAEAATKQSKLYECDGFNVEFSVTDEYENMFQADVTVTNTGKEVIRDWAFSCEFDHKITNIWNAQVLKAQEEFCVIGNYDWNQNIAPGATASFGFTAEKTERGEIVFPEYFEFVMQEAVTDSADYKADFTVYSDWGAGNNGALVITNLTGRRIHNWKISFVYGREIVSIANAVVESYENGVYTLRNADYNADLEPYGTVHISFNGGKGNGKEAATGFVLTETVFDLAVRPNTLSGTVTDAETGAALAGATVQALQGGTVIATALTDENGGYTFDLHKGTYTLWAEKEHYNGAEATFVSERNAKAPDVALSQIAYKLAGVVTDAESGAALAGVKVIVSGAEGVAAEAVTDETGAYAFDLYYGTYQLLFEKEHYNAAETVVVCGPETKATTIALVRDIYVLTGTVTDKVDGKALAGVKVTVTDETGVVTEVLTDERGNYSVEVYCKEYQIGFSLMHYESATITAIGGETEHTSIALERVVYYESGRVIDKKTKKPLAKVLVMVSQNGDSPFAVQTDENGYYRVGFYAGTYEVTFSKSKYEQVTVSREGKTESYTAENVELSVGKINLSMTLTLSGSSKPAAGLKYSIYEGKYTSESQITSGAKVVESGVVASNGQINMSLYPGTYTLVTQRGNVGGIVVNSLVYSFEVPYPS